MLARPSVITTATVPKVRSMVQRIAVSAHHRIIDPTIANASMVRAEVPVLMEEGTIATVEVVAGRTAARLPRRTIDNRATTVTVVEVEVIVVVAAVEVVVVVIGRTMELQINRITIEDLVEVPVITDSIRAVAAVVTTRAVTTRAEEVAVGAVVEVATTDRHNRHMDRRMVVARVMEPPVAVTIVRLQITPTTVTQTLRITVLQIVEAIRVDNIVRAAGTIKTATTREVRTKEVPLADGEETIRTTRITVEEAQAPGEAAITGEAAATVINFSSLCIHFKHIVLYYPLVLFVQIQDSFKPIRTPAEYEQIFMFQHSKPGHFDLMS